MQFGINKHKKRLHDPVGRVQFGVFTSAYLFQIAWEKSCDYLFIKYVQNFQTNSWQFVFILPYEVNMLHLLVQESDWSKNLCSCLYFACFCFWHYPLNFEFRCCCSQQNCLPVCFLVAVFSRYLSIINFLISTFCANFVGLHSKNFNFLHF